MKILRASAPTLLLIAAQLQSINVQADSLEQVIARTLEGNPQAQASLNRFQASTETVKVARGGYLPTLDFKTGVGSERLDSPYTRAVGSDQKDFKPKENALTLNQNLFDGLSTTNEYRKTREQQESHRELLRSKAEMLALDVADVYLKVMEQQRQVKLAQANLNTHERIHQLVQQRADQGVANQSDLYQIEGRLARARANVISSRNNLQDAESQYFRLVNDIPNDLSMPQINDIELPGELDEAIAIALKEHPALSASIYDVKASQHGYDQTRSQFMPKVDLSLTQRWDRDVNGQKGKHDDTLAMLSLNYNLFRGGSDSAKRQEAAYMLEESRANQQNAQRMVTESMKISWSALDSLTSEQPFLKRHMDASAQTVKAYKQQFDLGKRSLLDLLDSENESYQAQREYTNANYRVVYARYRVLNSMGQLLRKLNIGLPAGWHTES